MDKTRMEAFSDAVIAIIMTIMVLEMKIPHGEGWSALKPIIPVFLSYVMSFAYLAIYWNNHHHLLKAVKSIDGRVLWANVVLLFWLSLIPFVTGWMGENHFARNPVILYGVNLLLAGLSYNILVKVLLYSHGKDSLLAKAMGNDIKGKMSMVIYAAAIGLAFVSPVLAGSLYALVAVMWIVPDERIEKVLRS
ncbi:MAG: DUF1211 domain-containing protein [Candidatus Omnitrophica bacterium]|nr:DUF1211 domain-containing protein [Candidatus Omnitrophota bacterium]